MKRYINEEFNLGHKGRYTRVVVLLLLLAAVIVGGFFMFQRFFDLRPSAGFADNEEYTPYQVPDPLLVDEEYFTLELPGDWKELERSDTPQERSIAWQSQREDRTERFLKIYIDTIPEDKAINRLLPVRAEGNSLQHGELSYNCLTLTDEDEINRETVVPVMTSWQDISFWCNLPDLLGNEIGIGSADGLNKVRVTGRSQGEHEYFIVYNDSTVNPSSNILVNVVRSFRAK
jgi:hypothetical protein